MADRIGTRWLLPGSMLAAVAGMAIIAAALATGPSTDTPALVGAAVAGAGYGAVQNLTLVIAFVRAGPRRTATASAVWNAAFDSGTGIGAVAVGVTAAAGVGVPGAFGLSAVLIALSLPLVRWMRRPAD